jgi:hypothetical protein
MLLAHFRLFLLWYQALGDFAPDVLHAMFATLVPGFPTPIPGQGLPILVKNTSSSGSTVFHDTNHGKSLQYEHHDESCTYFYISGPVMPVELLPLLPPQSGDKQPEEPTRFFLDVLLENIVSQVQGP